MNRDAAERRSLFGQAISRLRPGGWPLRVIVLLLILILMLMNRGSPQYTSSISFSVTEASASPLGTAAAPTRSERDQQAISLVDYLQSDDVAATLAARDQLVERFRRPEADRLSRLEPAGPSVAQLSDYFRRHVAVRYSANTGVITATVRAFRPRDAMEIAARLLAIAGDRVARLNVTRFNAGFRAAQSELAAAEKSLADAESALRLPPPTSAEGSVPSPGTDRLASARNRLAIMARVLSPTSPQYVAMQVYVRRLEAIAPPAAASAAAASPAPDDAATKRYEAATRRYEAAAAGFDKARVEAEAGRAYVVRVAGPDLPQKAVYPMQFTRMAALVAILAALYGAARLIGRRRAGPVRGASSDAGDQPVR